MSDVENNSSNQGATENIPIRKPKIEEDIRLGVPGPPRPLQDVHLDDLLTEMVELGGSDLHIAVGVPPCIRKDGGLKKLNYENFKATLLQRMVYDILNDEQIQKFEENCDYICNCLFYDNQIEDKNQKEQKKLINFKDKVELLKNIDEIIEKYRNFFYQRMILNYHLTYQYKPCCKFAYLL